MSHSKTGELFQQRSNRTVVFSGCSLLAVCCVSPLILECLEASGDRHGAQAAVAEIPELESEIEFQSEELDALRLKLSTLRELMIHENEVSEFRTNLASLVRASECQLSNIIVEETYERPWKIGAGLHQTGDADDPDDFEELPYILQHHQQVFVRQ